MKTRLLKLRGFAALMIAFTPHGYAQPVDDQPAVDQAPATSGICSVDDPAPECGPGVWLGPMTICSAMKVVTRISYEEWSGRPVLIIDLDESLRSMLAELTTRLIGKPLPLRIDGRTIVEPFVNEPITEGSLMISGPDIAELKATEGALQICADAPNQNSRVSE